MNVTDVIAILSLITSVVAVGISWYSASESIRKHKLTMNQKCDLVVRPRGVFREMPPAKLMMEIQQINFMPNIPQSEKDTINKHWQSESLIFITEDIEDGDVYYGIIVKDEFDPLVIRNEILPTQYFDKVYVTKQGNKKHKKMKKGQKQLCKSRKQKSRYLNSVRDILMMVMAVFMDIGLFLILVLT